jgi:NAD(P)-dependent dehydrogenase (short-subunit alcohol dehydrogenase family)
LVVDMNDKKTWFITGAGRGMGVNFAKAALAAGHGVVATGRNPNAVSEAVGDADDLLVVTLDVTCRDDAQAAVRAAVDRFGRIDPGKVFDRTVDLDGVPDGYRAMADRESIKVMVKP